MEEPVVKCGGCLLKQVKKSIEHCENAKRKSLEYYNIHWREMHETLLRVKEELEQKLP